MRACVAFNFFSFMEIDMGREFIQSQTLDGSMGAKGMRYFVFLYGVSFGRSKCELGRVDGG